MGLPVNRWTLSLLAQKAVELGIVDKISHEWVRQILKAKRISLKRTKTWKETKDPQCVPKWKRIKRLYERCPKNAVVICFDEMGPFSLRPVHGKSYTPSRKPDRLPANYRRTRGISYLLAYYDVHGDYLWGKLVRRRAKKAVFSFRKLVRSRYPKDVKLHLIMDDLNLHKTEEMARWARQNNVELVWPGVNASWMSRIEAHSAPLKERVVANSYYQSQEDLSQAITEYISWRNQEAKKGKADTRQAA